MSPAEKLKAAAERLGTLHKAASESPWEVTEHHGFDFSGEGYSTVTLTMRETDGDVAKWYGETERERPDADLIATLRPLAPILAEQLRAASVQAGNITKDPISGRTWHDVRYCGGEPGVTCDCFDDALALADAVLAATP